MKTMNNLKLKTDFKEIQRLNEVIKTLQGVANMKISTAQIEELTRQREKEEANQHISIALSKDEEFRKLSKKEREDVLKELYGLTGHELVDTYEL